MPRAAGAAKPVDLALQGGEPGAASERTGEVVRRRDLEELAGVAGHLAEPVEGGAQLCRLEGREILGLEPERGGEHLSGDLHRKTAAVRELRLCGPPDEVAGWQVDGALIACGFGHGDRRRYRNRCLRGWIFGGWGRLPDRCHHFLNGSSTRAVFLERDYMPR